MFSIPFGRLFKDYDKRAIAIAKSLSINVVLSAYGGGNTEGQPLYNIRRTPVTEVMLAGGIDQFIKSLHHPAISAEFIKKERELSRCLSGRI
jgi:hypothetical protein